jgi:glycosyltransferase involved in cell wall biosynthesis
VPYSLFFGKENDLTHFFNYIVPPYVHGKTVVTIHDMVYKAFPETVRGRTKQMLEWGLIPSMKRADRIITDSDFSKSEIIKYYPEFQDKIRVVYCGVDSEKFHPVTNQKQIQTVRQKYHVPENYFLYLGTLEPRKNLERLIDAYFAFSKEYSKPAGLVLAGGKGWMYEGIFEKVQSLNLQKHVIFTQYIPEKDLCALMSGAMAFVFPSLYEGFGMPPLEAMSCGTPVLVSDRASLPEVVGESAVIVKANSVKSIQEGLHRLHDNSGLREQLKQKGAAARGAGFAHGDYEGNELQLPALFILDEQGTVLYSHYAEHLMDMPDVDGVLALLETLKPVS